MKHEPGQMVLGHKNTLNCTPSRTMFSIVTATLFTHQMTYSIASNECQDACMDVLQGRIIKQKYCMHRSQHYRIYIRKLIWYSLYLLSLSLSFIFCTRPKQLYDNSMDCREDGYKHPFIIMGLYEPENSVKKLKMRILPIPKSAFSNSNEIDKIKFNVGKFSKYFWMRKWFTKPFCT